MKKLVLVLALAALGCGSNSNNGNGSGNGSGGGSGGGGSGSNAGGYVGTWKGEASGWTLTATVTSSTEAGGSYYLEGTATTNKSNCLATGPLSATITSASRASVIITDKSNSDRQITIQGTATGNTLTGTFESQSEQAACVVKSTAITLTKQ